MNLEIERKFLVISDLWRETPGIAMKSYRQGYIGTSFGRGGITVRVRAAGDQAWITVKGPTKGISRAEYEYQIPVADANAMLDTLCPTKVEKRRHFVPVHGVVFEVDEFLGENAGLIIAELELPSEEAEFPRPAWLGRDVTDDVRFHNSVLAKNPFRSWPKNEIDELL